VIGTPLELHPDRLLPPETATRAVARRLYDEVRDLPIVSPHGHCDPAWWADDQPFADPAALLVTPDHYLTRMLHSQGVPLEHLGRSPAEGGRTADPREVWRTFATHYHLFRGTPSRLWLDHALAEVLEVKVRPSAATADETYDHIADRLARPDHRPRALFDRFGIDFLATTESPLDDLAHHRAIQQSGWTGRVVTSFRPDPVVDPDRADFDADVDRLGELTGTDTATWSGYLDALRIRRAHFIENGARSTDHGHPTATTADLDPAAARRLFDRVRTGRHDDSEAELFRGQMLTEMVRMSLDDGLVVQLHPGVWRDHDPEVWARFGPDAGADIPVRTDYVGALKPLLDRFGAEPGLTMVLFTLDETTYSRELAPMAGHYPLLRLGAPWWFHDSPEGMRRFRRRVTGTAGFANTVGFTDDTRAFLSIPARHDVARRIDCGFLAELVVEHRLDEDEALESAVDLTHRLARTAYRIGEAPTVDEG
jgi:glucuronate isomerase